MKRCPECFSSCRVVNDEWGNPLLTPWIVECSRCDYRTKPTATADEAVKLHERASAKGDHAQG